MHKRFLLIFLLGVLSAACSLRPAVPMPKIEYFANDEPSGPLVVLLRGIGGRMDYYERNGWVDAARDARHAMDMVAPDAHFGYYVGRSIATRLHEDIIGRNGRRVIRTSGWPVSRWVVWVRCYTVANTPGM